MIIAKQGKSVTKSDNKVAVTQTTLIMLMAIILLLIFVIFLRSSIITIVIILNMTDNTFIIIMHDILPIIICQHFFPCFLRYIFCVSY